MQTRIILRMEDENKRDGRELNKDFILTRESFYNLTYYNNSISNMFRKWSMCAFVSPPRFYFPFCFSNERIYYNNTGESIFFICNFVVSRHDGILYDSFLFLLFLRNEKSFIQKEQRRWCLWNGISWLYIQWKIFKILNSIYFYITRKNYKWDQCLSNYYALFCRFYFLEYFYHKFSLMTLHDNKYT